MSYKYIIKCLPSGGIGGYYICVCDTKKRAIEIIKSKGDYYFSKKYNLFMQKGWRKNEGKMTNVEYRIEPIIYEK